MPFDEISGLIHAYSLIRPEEYNGMELKGVKRFKEKGFAANVNREEIMDAIERAEVELETIFNLLWSSRAMQK